MSKEREQKSAEPEQRAGGREDDESPPDWDQPSRAPGFEGATPQALARALFRPVMKGTSSGHP